MSDEEIHDRRVRQLRQNLERAQQARKEISELKRELRAGNVDPYELVAGNDERWEPRIENLEIQKVLKMIPGVGTSRMIDVLMATDLPPTAKTGSFTWQRRQKVAQAVRDVLEVNI